MKCEVCNKNDATVHVKQALNGHVKEMHLCPDCASKSGVEVQAPMPQMTDFLFGVEVNRDVDSGNVDLLCPGCGMSREKFRKTSRLGCASCYDTFAEDIELLLKDWQKDLRHVGKIPAGEKLTVELKGLQKALDKAIAAQDFEEAAILRDKIQEIKARTTLPSLPSSDG